MHLCGKAIGLDAGPFIEERLDRGLPISQGQVSEALRWKARDVLTLFLWRGYDVDASVREDTPRSTRHCMRIMSFPGDGISGCLSGRLCISWHSLARSALFGSCLVEACIDPSIKDNMGDTALDRARQFNREALVKLLEEVEDHQTTKTSEEVDDTPSEGNGEKEQVQHKFVLHGYVHTKHLHVHSGVG